MTKKEQIIAARIQGKDYKTIVQEVGCSIHYVNEICEKESLRYKPGEKRSERPRREPTKRKEREAFREAKRKQKEDIVNKMIALAQAGECIDNIAAETGYSYGHVQQKLRDLGIKPQRKKHKRAATLNHEKIREYYAEGHTAKEAADAFGASTHYVQKICAGIRSGNQYTNGLFDREANAKRYIDERTPWFEYAGNFTGIDGFVDLKCKMCGTVVTRSFVSVKHGVACCDECERRKREQRQCKKQQETERRKREREERARRKRLSFINTQLALKECSHCGALFVPAGNRSKYCSDDCLRRAESAKRKDKRIRSIKRITVDDDISLERLYKRDKGVCAICGGRCDWADHTIRKDGTFIARAYYPSIDHIQPISKGGLHAWDNVQLAHFICNSRKGAAMDSSPSDRVS